MAGKPYSSAYWTAADYLGSRDANGPALRTTCNYKPIELTSKPEFKTSMRNDLCEMIFIACNHNDIRHGYCSYFQLISKADRYVQ